MNTNAAANTTGDGLFVVFEFPIINVLIELKYVESYSDSSVFADYIAGINSGQMRV